MPAKIPAKNGKIPTTMTEKINYKNACKNAYKMTIKTPAKMTEIMLSKSLQNADKMAAKVPTKCV